MYAKISKGSDSGDENVKMKTQTLCRALQHSGLWSLGSFGSFGECKIQLFSQFSSFNKIKCYCYAQDFVMSSTQRFCVVSLSWQCDCTIKVCSTRRSSWDLSGISSQPPNK